MFTIGQVTSFKSFIEIFLKLSLIFVVRESKVMQYIFYCLKEEQSKFDLMKMILKSSFFVDDKPVSAKFHNSKLHFEDLNFIDSKTWIISLFQMFNFCIEKTVFTNDTNCVIQVIDYLLQTILQKDVLNLLQKFCHLTFKDNVFGQEAFNVETNNFLLDSENLT